MMTRELNTELNGIAPSLHTPFNDDQSIDYISLKKLLEHTIETSTNTLIKKEI